MEKKIRMKECAMCGKVFAVSGRGNRCYCGDRCRREKILQTSREYRESLVARKLEPMGRIYTAHEQGLAELNRRARDAGTSYGKYQAELRLGRCGKEEHGKPKEIKGSEV